MDDIKILPNVSIPSVRLQSVRMPVVGNGITLPSGGGILDDIKSHMLGWYDVKRQGCTNESLTENPVLTDLSGKNHPLELKNFVFDGKTEGIGVNGKTDALYFNANMSYGIISSIPENSAKCVMMDIVVPTSASYGVVYDQRINVDTRNFAINLDIDFTAYNSRNISGTYINGVFNQKTKARELLDKRHVISVNCANPNNRIIFIGSNTNTNYRANFYLYSLILFDRVLTEEEMKLVMDRLMMYEDVDNIAAINQDIALPVMGIADDDRDLD